MRIGELACLVGISTRAIRHYHQVGLLPEPARKANGYRIANGLLAAGPKPDTRAGNHRSFG